MTVHNLMKLRDTCAENFEHATMANRLGTTLIPTVYGEVGKFTSM